MNPILRKQICQQIWCVLVCGSFVTLSASPPIIGVARSRGAFVINNASVPGSATLLDGTSVRTMESSSGVSLNSGERLTLAPGSSARIYENRLVLENGMAELDHMNAYRIETGDLRIGASAPETHLRVAIESDRQVRVGAVGGTAEVRNPEGVLVARVFPGTALQLQSAGRRDTVVTGIVENRGGHFFLTDETTRVTVELRGSDLKNLVGRHVRITGPIVSGATPAAGASSVVNATQVVIVAPAAASTVPAAAAVVGGPSSTVVAVIGGVAAGSTVGGLAAAGTFSGSDPTVSR